MGATGTKSGKGPKGTRAGVLTDDTIVAVKMTVRAATGLLRALAKGDPMAGPDVTPLVQELSNVLNSGSPGKKKKGKSSPGLMAGTGG